MLAQIEALSYRCLRYVRQSLYPFQVLIGPNASGKSTFLDVVAFLADVLREQDGVAAAIAAERSWGANSSAPRCSRCAGRTISALLCNAGIRPC